MRRVILYRYHGDFEKQIPRLQLLRKFNPSVPIYGLYGGAAKDHARASALLDDYLEHNYLIKDYPPEFKWMHADYVYKDWHKDVGRHLNFDMLHVVEWDLLLLDSIGNLYAHIPYNAVGCTGLIGLEKIEKNWYWAKDAFRRSELEKFVEGVREKYQIAPKLYGMLGPGVSFPRSFLDGFIELEHPLYQINEELRIPVWAQVLDHPLENTRFRRNWFSRKEIRAFNAYEGDINERVIRKAMSKKGGQRAFHPYRSTFDPEQLYQLSCKMNHEES